MGGSLLKEKAKAFAKELGIEFSASEGWLTNFNKRNRILTKKMCEESSSVAINVCSKWQNSLSDLIKEYELPLITIDKAWRAVTPLTIHSCFKKSGFPSPNLVDVDDTLTEFNAEPSLWAALP
ncbi:HTH CENPB-type domain-containing protein [Trichonephila clavipes]|uniref:HTH CENPB-type domain-containing protein n=1 Tax=Trichonephila clavipes TaxID=2585209 RepID=A0A8X6SXT7_TRICX|nr:HTH CENPB-type domain-containing protein [Trichonephila clavipes]